MPPSAVRELLQLEEWKACLEAWIVLAEMRLNLTEKEFRLSAPKDESAVSFLSTYFQEASSSSASLFHSGAEAKRLRRFCFLLVRRLLLELQPPPPGFLDWKFLGNLSEQYVSTRALETLLGEVWKRESEKITLSIEEEKQLVIKQLAIPRTAQLPGLLSTLRKLTLLSTSLPQAGHALMTGSDYLDTLAESYQDREDPALRKALVANVYVGLVSLTKTEPPLTSLLLDQLFSLKGTAMNPKRPANEPTLLSDLICSSNFLSRIQGFFETGAQKRSESLLSALQAYQKDYSPLHSRYRRPRKVDKGKGRAVDNAEVDGVDMHKMSLITQVQDLFPDLGSGYVTKLLGYFSDNPETVISHLLDDSLPPELRNLDQSEPLAAEAPDFQYNEPEPPLPPSQTPTTFTRKNAFDNDDFDHLKIPESKLHFGRANPELTADDVLADRTHHSTSKAAIISALEAFDSDEDERDDTYDVADVGGTLDSGLTAGDDDEAAADLRRRNEANSQEANELALFKLYKSSPDAFGRSAVTRRSKERVALRKETAMTDEAIEGWALMLSRDPKRMEKLEGKSSLSAGAVGQRELAPTSYRKQKVTDSEGNATGTEESEAERTDGARGGRGGGGRGGRRGGNRGGGGRGGRGRGDVAGSSGDRDTTAARQNKDANKSSRANHSRRDQRAKKMARGGM